MPDITISLTGPQATRAASAFRFLNDDGSDATLSQVTAWVRQRLRGEVLRREKIEAEAAAVAAVQDF